MRQSYLRIVTIFCCMIFLSCFKKKPEIKFDFLEEIKVEGDSIYEGERSYIFSNNSNLDLKFPITFKDRKYKFEDYDVVVSLSFPVKQIYIADPDLCMNESNRKPVEIEIDSKAKKKKGYIFVYRIFPKGKYRTVCP
jgi:hypothetical protein